MLSVMRNVLSVKNEEKTISVHIKGRFPVVVDVHPGWKIETLKGILAPKYGVGSEQLSVFFSGRILENSTFIKECNLGEQSVLHVVEKCLQKRRTRANLSVKDDTNFYVYCSNCSECPKNGKIRVKCKCGSGAIELNRDPNCWEDVINNRITGSCKLCPAGDEANASFYFKCTEHKALNENEEAVFLYHIRPNRIDVPCLSCTEVLSPILVFGCGHTTCLPCFKTYCITKISERGFILDDNIGYTLPCPVGCPNSYIKEPHHFKILPVQLYQKYQKFATEEFLLKNGGIFCPKNDCGEGILTNEYTNKVTCTRNDCQYEFCKLCREKYHEGQCRQTDRQKWNPIDLIKAGKARWDERATINTINKISKPCPKCKSNTERDGGCMHLYCTRCGFDWCWICGEEWNGNCRSKHWFG